MAGGSAPARRISADRGSPPTGPLRRALLLLHAPLGIEIEDRRGRRGAHRLHQFHVAGELLAHRRRDLRQRLQGAGLARLLMVVQGLLRVLAGQQRSGLGFAVLADDADHDMPQLHLAGIHPGSRLLPEHGAVRAVRVAEQVDHARRVGTAIGDPGALLHLLPHFLGQRRIHQALQRFAAEVLALGVEQVAGEYVLAVGRQVQRHALVLVFGGVAAQAIRGVEAAEDAGALLLDHADRRRQLLRRRGQAGVEEGQAQAKGDQVARQSHSELLVAGAAAAGSKASR